MRLRSASGQVFLSLMMAALVVPRSSGQQPLWTQMQEQAQRQEQAQQRQDAEKSAAEQKKSHPRKAKKKEKKKEKDKKQSALAPDSPSSGDQN